MGLALLPPKSGQEGLRLYVSDTGNNRLRLIETTPNGKPGEATVRTVAGRGSCCGRTFKDGTADEAELAFPMDIALSRNGKGLLFADYNNARVRELDFGSAKVSTLAGDGRWNFTSDKATAALQSSLKGPRGVTVDANTGEIFVADALNQRIREVSAAKGSTAPAPAAPADLSATELAAVRRRLHAQSAAAAAANPDADWRPPRSAAAGLKVRMRLLLLLLLLLLPRLLLVLTPSAAARRCWCTREARASTTTST